MVVRGVRSRARPERRGRRPLRSFACLLATGLALCLPDRPLAIPALPSEWRPAGLAQPRTAAAALPEPQSRRLSQAQFDHVWGQVKYTMAACNSAVDGVQLAWRAQGRLPNDADLRAVQERCQRASAEVAGVDLPASAPAPVEVMLRQARDACQRSMVEKQLGLAALKRLAEAPPASLEAYEARIRVEAAPRSSLNCAASFAAAAAAARLRMSELEVGAV